MTLNSLSYINETESALLLPAVMDILALSLNF